MTTTLGCCVFGRWNRDDATGEGHNWIAILHHLAGVAIFGWEVTRQMDGGSLGEGPPLVAWGCQGAQLEALRCLEGNLRDEGISDFVNPIPFVSRTPWVMHMATDKSCYYVYPQKKTPRM